MRILIPLPQWIINSSLPCGAWSITWSSSQKFPTISYYLLSFWLQQPASPQFSVLFYCIYLFFNILVINEYASSLSCLYKIRQENGEQTPGKSCLSYIKKHIWWEVKIKLTYLSCEFSLKQRNRLGFVLKDCDLIEFVLLEPMNLVFILPSRVKRRPYSGWDRGSHLLRDILSTHAGFIKQEILLSDSIW